MRAEKDVQAPKAKAGNLGAEFFSIWVDPETNQGHFAQHTLDLIDSVYEQAARHPDREADSGSGSGDAPGTDYPLTTFVFIVAGICRSTSSVQT